MELAVLLLAWMVAGGSPGPATLAIAGTAMQDGRGPGVAVAAGVLTGSAFWGVAAALGLSALMLTHAWVFEAVRVIGALFLLYLAFRAFRSAWRGPKPLSDAAVKARRLSRYWGKGALIHLTNPKAILAWGAVFAVAVPPSAGPAAVFSTLALLLTSSAIVFLGYGVLFSSATAVRLYRRAQRGFELVFGGLFGAVGLTLLLSRGQTI